MGHTNETSVLKLPQFIADDKPTFMGDINGAFQKIDYHAGQTNSNLELATTNSQLANTKATQALEVAEAANRTVVSVSADANQAYILANNALTVANNTAELSQAQGMQIQDIDGRVTSLEGVESGLAFYKEIPKWSNPDLTQPYIGTSDKEYIAVETVTLTEEEKSRFKGFVLLYNHGRITGTTNTREFSLIPRRILTSVGAINGNIVVVDSVFVGASATVMLNIRETTITTSDRTTYTFRTTRDSSYYTGVSGFQGYGSGNTLKLAQINVIIE